jgi:hypothetical protein
MLFVEGLTKENIIVKLKKSRVKKSRTGKMIFFLFKKRSDIKTIRSKRNIDVKSGMNGPYRR